MPRPRQAQGVDQIEPVDHRQLERAKVDQRGIRWVRHGVALGRSLPVRARPRIGQQVVLPGASFDARRREIEIARIGRTAADRGRSLTNWAVWVKLGDGSTPPPRREDWSRHGRLDDVLPHFAHWRFDWFDVPALMRRTPVFYEYPMCDREPLDRWSFGRVTLLGDAAHPMYPVGSNGAAQAILDARCLARTLGSHRDVAEALQAYEAERLAAANQVVLSNRKMGPERVIDIVAERAPAGFERLDDVISHEELLGIAMQYRKVAGFERERLADPKR
jgi:FAD binding domain